MGCVASASEDAPRVSDKQKPKSQPRKYDADTELSISSVNTPAIHIHHGSTHEIPQLALKALTPKSIAVDVEHVEKASPFIATPTHRPTDPSYHQFELTVQYIHNNELAMMQVGQLETNMSMNAFRSRVLAAHRFATDCVPQDPAYAKWTPLLIHNSQIMSDDATLHTYNINADTASQTHITLIRSIKQQ